jgi:hypothetical protein
MTDKVSRLSRKELYSGSMVIFIAIFYFILISSSLVQLMTSRSKINFEWEQLKMMLLTTFYFISGILFLMKKKSGWVMSAATLLNFILYAILVFWNMSQSFSGFQPSVLILVMTFILLLLAFLFLFNKNTRKRFQVNNKSYLMMIFVYLVLLTMTFTL